MYGRLIKNRSSFNELCTLDRSVIPVDCGRYSFMKKWHGDTYQAYTEIKKGCPVRLPDLDSLFEFSPYKDSCLSGALFQ